MQKRDDTKVTLKRDPKTDRLQRATQKGKFEMQEMIVTDLQRHGRSIGAVQISMLTKLHPNEHNQLLQA